MSLEPLRNLTDIGLFVSNMERALAFYGETLGFELKRVHEVLFLGKAFVLQVRQNLAPEIRAAFHMGMSRRMLNLG